MLENIMLIQSLLENTIKQILQASNITEEEVHVQPTNPQFVGEYTLVLFPFIKALKTSPEAIGNKIGQYVCEHLSEIASYNIVKGFLNFTVADTYWAMFLSKACSLKNFAIQPTLGKTVVLDFSSPNTNKPLHLGHLRNNFLGMSICRMMEAAGYEVYKTCIVNDRGVHICKSMWAWQKFSGGITPQQADKKGDHLVGDYYVLFEKELKQQAQTLAEKIRHGDTSITTPEIKALQTQIEKATDEKKHDLEKKLNELIRNETPAMQEIRQMLLAWENKDSEIIRLWQTMNGWVYEGFDITYKRIGTEFDKIYYESDTYILGKQYVLEALQNGVAEQKSDNSIWIDLTAEGLDEKLLLRSDGTSVYITQDFGLADIRYQDKPYQQCIYVVGDEQNYHFQVLKCALQKMKKPYADGIFHLSYGMVELPSGKMKSREGTVVDADDLIDAMVTISEEQTKLLGKTDNFSKEEFYQLTEAIGLAALKFFLLRVNPKKRIVFNPEESIDLHGFTGPFVQYTYARIQSILRKDNHLKTFDTAQLLTPVERELIKLLESYRLVIQKAAAEYDPSILAQYVYQVAKVYNSFYAEHSVLQAENEDKKQLRLHLCTLCSRVLKNGLFILGIEAPERM